MPGLDLAPMIAPLRDFSGVDAALARRLEAVEEYGDLHSTRLLIPRRPECAVQAIGGGHMCYSGKESPIGRAHGLGFAGEVQESLIEEVEAFYHSRGVPAQVDICPYSHPTLLELLKRRGYAVAEFNSVLARRIQPDDTFPLPAGVTIRRVLPQESPAWAELLDRGFGDGKPVGFAWLVETWAELEDGICLIAEVDGKVAGGASGMILREHKVGGLFGASTLPEFRGRGVQTALLRARMEIVRAAGCDIAVTLTMPGTVSQRNAERAGMRVAFTKAVVVKNP